MGKKNKPDSMTPQTQPKKGKFTEDAKVKLKSKLTPLDNKPDSQERIQIEAHNAQHTVVFEPHEITPPVTVERPQLNSGSTKRSTLVATLEKSIEQNTQLFALFATHLGANAVAKTVVEAPTADPGVAKEAIPETTPAPVAAQEDHTAEAAAVAPAEEAEESMPLEEQEALMDIIDSYLPEGVTPKQMYLTAKFVHAQQTGKKPQLDNMLMGMELMAPLGLKKMAEAAAAVRIMRMNGGRITMVKIRDHLITYATKPKAVVDPAGAGTSADAVIVPYAVVAGAGDTAIPARWEHFRSDPDPENGLVTYCAFHGFTTHSTRQCKKATPAQRAEDQKAHDDQRVDEEQIRTAVALSKEEMRREIGRAFAAGEQLNEQQRSFLLEETGNTDPTGQVTVAAPPARPLPPPPPLELEVSLGPDLHLDLTNLSVSRGARVQLPNPEPFDGNLRKLIPDVYRTPADYVYALASTAIRSDMPLPEVTKTFFKGMAKTWQHQTWIELKNNYFPADPHCLTDQRYTKKLAVAFLLQFEQHFAAQLRQRSTVAMEAFLSEAYHQRQDEPVALYFARFSVDVQEAGGFTERQKVIYFRAGLRADIRKYSTVDQEGNEFESLSDLFRHALAQERRASAFYNRPTVAVSQQSLAYLQGGRGRGRSGRSTRAGGRQGGGRHGGRDHTGRASAGVQKHTAPYRGGHSGAGAQGHAQGQARSHGQSPALATAPPGMTWSARQDPATGGYSYVLVPSRQQREEAYPQQGYHGGETARGRGRFRGRGRSSGRHGKHRVALIDSVRDDDMPLPPPLTLHYDAGAEEPY